MLAVALLALPARGEGPKPYAGTLKSLERVAMTLAERGRSTDLKDLVSILEGFGHPEKALERLRGRTRKALAGAGIPPASMPGVAKRIRRAATAIAKHLETAPQDERKELAQLILRLDDAQDAAHRALGHEKKGGVWTSAALTEDDDRRREIEDAVDRAIALEAPLEEGVSELGFVEAIQGKKGRVLRWENVSLHTASVGRSRLEQLLTQNLRAMAMSQFFREGKVEIPRPGKPYTAIICGSDVEYRAAVEKSLEDGGLTRRNARIAKMTSRYQDSRGFRVVDVNLIPRQQAGILVDLWHWWLTSRYYKVPQPALAAGHLNWLCLHFFRRPIPGFVWANAAGRTAAERNSEWLKDAIEEAKRSVYGTRTYMAYLAERGDDPLWSASMGRRIGEINGDDLIKCTQVAAYLQERGRFFELLVGTIKKPRKPATFQEALGQPLPAFEEEWRAWVGSGSSKSLAACVEGAPR